MANGEVKRLFWVAAGLVAGLPYLGRILAENEVFASGLPGLGLGVGIIGLYGLAVAGMGLMALWRRWPAGGWAWLGCGVLGIVFTAWAPTPPTAVEVHFWQHQAQYEALVAQARAGQLPTSPACGQAFAPPPGAETLARACIYVSAPTDPVWMVEFTPAGFYRPVVYIADPDQLEKTHSACHGDGVVFRHLTPNWHLCQRDWN